MKRTTLIIEAQLYAALKQRAATDWRTLSETVENALRLGLEAMASGRRSRVKLPSYDLGPFLIDPTDRAGWPEVPRAREDGPEEDA